VAVVARALGQLWTALTADDKLPYQQQAALEREQVAAATEAWNKVHGNSAAVDAAIGAAIDDNGNTMHKDSTQLIFPMARIRKICKLDPDVRGLSKEATLLITKCAELVTAKLGVESVRMATIQNRRKLLPEDVVQVCSAREQFLFLREDMVDLVRRSTQGKESNSGSGESGATKPSSSSALSSSTNSKGAKDNALAAKNTKPLTAFFKAAS
jgi:DNA-directed RNA polymerase I subunit RPA43